MRNTASCSNRLTGELFRGSNEVANEGPLLGNKLFDNGNSGLQSFLFGRRELKNARLDVRNPALLAYQLIKDLGFSVAEIDAYVHAI